MFSFLCKQNQSAQVCQVLSSWGKPRVRRYTGPRGEGVMVTLESGKSRRFLNKALYLAGVPGSVSGGNNLPVVKVRKGELYMLKYENLPAKFVLSYMGRIGKASLSWYQHCECCGVEVTLSWKGETFSI